MKYDEANAINDVSEFHDTFNLPILDSPIIPSAERCKLRINLLEEELNELKEAIEENDIIEVIDAFCDIQYVLSGAILEFGFADVFKKMFDEVQRSNMSKMCKSEEEAIATQKHYEDKDGTPSHIVKKNDGYLVYRNEDGKVLKSVNYSPAELKDLMP